MSDKLLLGVSGEVGSFSEQAGQQYAERENIAVELKYLLDMQGVLAALNSGSISRGIFPVVNQHGGLVNMAFEAMGQYPFQPLDEIWLQVDQCLLARPEITSQQITHIVSHPQALAQCRHYLQVNFPTIEQKPWQDTAKAAEALQQGELSATSAVIAPFHCAELYHLELVARNIQDSNPNLTAFIVVEKRSSAT